MAETLYASFSDASLAEKAAGALLDYGVKSDDISLVARGEDDGSGRRDYVTHSATLAEREPAVTTPPAALGAPGFTGAVPYTTDMDPDYTEADLDDPIDDRGSASTAYGGAASGDNRTLETHASETDLSAKHGLSTTTPGDAASGAAKGAGIGLGVGVLAALASLMVPGFGLVAGGGALATAIAGAAGATAAGALSGGVLGYLKDQGVSDEVAATYDETVKNGGALLSVHLPSGDVDRAQAEEVLSKYQAQNVQTFGANA